MCQLKVFCCGCSLRVGVISAAISTIISAILFVLLGAFVITFTFVKSPKAKARVPELDHNTHFCLSPAVCYAGGSLLIFTGVLLLVGFAGLLITLFMPRVHRGLLLWLVCHLIHMVLVAGFVVGSAWTKAWPFLSLALPLAFAIYLWIVVLAHYRELLRKEAEARSLELKKNRARIDPPSEGQPTPL